MGDEYESYTTISQFMFGKAIYRDTVSCEDSRYYKFYQHFYLWNEKTNAKLEIELTELPKNDYTTFLDFQSKFALGELSILENGILQSVITLKQDSTHPAIISTDWSRIKKYERTLTLTSFLDTTAWSPLKSISSVNEYLITYPGITKNGSLIRVEKPTTYRTKVQKDTFELLIYAKGRQMENERYQWVKNEANRFSLLGD